MYELQDPCLKITITNLSKDFSEFKGETKKQIAEFKEKELMETNV